MICAHLDAHLAQALHDEGIPQGKRHLKLFTFSRLLGPYRLQTGVSWYEAKAARLREAIRRYLAHPRYVLQPNA